MLISTVRQIKGQNEYVIDEDGWITIYGFGSMSGLRELPFVRIPPLEAQALAREVLKPDLLALFQAS